MHSSTSSNLHAISPPQSISELTPRGRKPVVGPQNERVCTICGCEISESDHWAFQSCNDWRCRLERNTRLQKETREFEAEFEARVKIFNKKRDDFLAENAKNENIVNAEDYLAITVPVYHQKEKVPVSDDRRERLRANILKAIDEANNAEEPADLVNSFNSRPCKPVDNGLAILFQNGCSTCGGHCCSDGGDKAFLDGKKLREYLDAHPDCEPDDAIDHYLSYVPEKAADDNCIFRGDRGCTLPRKMRSDICNSFECYGLTKLREEHEQGQAKMLIIATDSEDFFDHRFVDATTSDVPAQSDSAINSP